MRTIQPVKVSNRGRGPCGCPDGLGQPGQEVSRIGVVTMTLAILMVCGPLSEQVIRINCSVSAMPGSSGLLGPAAGLLRGGSPGGLSSDYGCCVCMGNKSELFSVGHAAVVEAGAAWATLGLVLLGCGLGHLGPAEGVAAGLGRAGAEAAAG